MRTSSDRSIKSDEGLTRRRLVGLGGAALLYPLLSGFSCQSPITGDRLLDEMERTAFRFFWEETSPNTGLTKDRALADSGDTRRMASIAATGFGLTALCIAAQRKYAPAADLRARVFTALRFLDNHAPHQNGFFYHFLDMDSGERMLRSEASSIDTAILLCGILTAREYFQDPQITAAADRIYRRVDWPWLLNGGTTFSMAWTPERGFTPARWNMYAEEMMIYLLAMASPTHNVPAGIWHAFSRQGVEYRGIRYISGDAPLFIHQYSHAWFDFRDKRDAYANYFENSVKATKAHKLFCISLADRFPDYSEHLWGITSSDSVRGYVAWGGPPATGPIDGTIVPAAAAGSLPFLYSDTMDVLQTIRTLYPSTWKKYGFVDAFNPLTDWIDPDVIGIDTGISMLMAENARTGFVWSTFMTSPEAQRAMMLAGFH